MRTTNSNSIVKTVLLLLLSLSHCIHGQVIDDEFLCGDDGKITIIGSTTVFPVSASFALGYSSVCPTVSFNTQAGGSSAGARSVCAAQTETSDIGNMSRDWNRDEAVLVGNGKYRCVFGNNSREVVQIPYAIDGVPIFTGIDTTIFTECLSKLPKGLSLAELRWLFSDLPNIEQPQFSDGDPNTRYWSEICGTNNSKIPLKQKVKIYAPSPEYGTHDFFKEVVFQGEDFRSDIKYFDDNNSPLRDAVANDPFGIGFLGFSYFIKNTNFIASIPIEGIEPNEETLTKDVYKPLGRRIYSNFLAESLSRTSCFGYYGLSETGSKLVDETGFLPIPSTEFPSLRNRLGKCGKSSAPTLSPTARTRACQRFCWWFASIESCCNKRRRDAKRCKCV